MTVRILALLIICCANSSAQEIPLSEIWALDMPGTKDVYGLGFAEPDRHRDAGMGPVEFRAMRKEAIDQMSLALYEKLPSERAAKGFIVPWNPNSHMLKRAGSILREAKRYDHFDVDIKEYPKGSDITLIYFSHPSSCYNHIKEIKREGHEITVKYQLVPHYTVDSTAHFALIPLENLEVGEYEVKFEQLRMEQKFEKAGFIPFSSTQRRRYVCNDFSFRIWEPVEPDRTEATEDAIEIPLDSVWGFHMPGTRDTREIDTPHPTSSRTTAQEISRSLHTSKIGQKAGPILAVKGSGEEALVSIERIISKRMQAPLIFSPSDEINLYVFTRCSAGARLDRIMRDGRQIRIEYHFGSREDGGVPLRFVLVPLGKLEEGRYSVEMVMKPRQPDSENKYYPVNRYGVVSPDYLRTCLCQNTSFSVQ